METQKLFKWGQIVLIVLAVFLAVETLGALKNLRNIDPVYNSISVTGEGEAISIPDMATFSFSVSADAESASSAQETVTKKMDATLVALGKLGVEKKDIKTTDYSVWPKYNYEPVVCLSTYCPPMRQVPDGYSANHSVSVKIRKTEDAGEALALVGESGATNLSGLSFIVDDPEKIFEEARTEAISNAKLKAKTLAKSLGVRLVRVVSFYDNTGGGPMPYAEGFGGDMVKISGASVPTIPIGENKIKVTVTVTYEIR